MATTPTHGIVYPVVGNTITPLATHFANLANSTDTALVTLSNGLYGYSGLESARNALAGARLREGVQWFATDSNLEYFYNGSAWRLVPGQVLGTMYSTPANVTTANAIAGTVLTTVSVPSGQPFILQAGPVGVFSGSAGSIQFQVRWTTNGSAVTVGTGSFRDIRGYSPGTSVVVQAPGPLIRDTAASANTISAAIYLITGVSGFGLYGPDGFYLQAVSA